MTVTAASHPPSALTLLPRYVNLLTVSTSSHNFTSCSTDSLILPLHFLHAKFLEDFGVTIFTPAHLTWNPFTTPLTQNWVGLCSSAADPTWINVTLRHATHCDATTDHYLGFRSEWKLPLRSRITFRPCRSPKLLNFLYLSSRFWWRIGRCR